MGQLDSGKYIDALSRVEQRLTEKVRLEHFGRHRSRNRQGGLATLSRNPPSGKPAHEPDFSPCLITFARMFPVVRIFSRWHCWNAAVAC